MSSADPNDSHDEPRVPRARLVAEDPPRTRSSRRIYLGTAFLAVFALFGWIVWWAWEEAASGGAEPPLVRADDAPYKRAPDTADGADAETGTQGVSSVFAERREAVRIERLLPRQADGPPGSVEDLLPPEEPPPEELLAGEPLTGETGPAAEPPAPGAGPSAAPAQAPTAASSATEQATAALPRTGPEPEAAATEEPGPESDPAGEEEAPPEAETEPTPVPAPIPAARPARAPAVAPPASEPPAATTGTPRQLTARTPEPATATPAPAAQAPAAGADGRWLIQIAALSSREAVSRAWERLQGRHRQLLGGLSLRIDEVSSGNGKLYRMQAAAFTDRNEAARVCADLKAAGTDCFVVGRR